jgi:HAD superfamily hydrolase (TIGR01509 family)
MTKFKNIIFDLGGVILDIDYNLTIKAFSDLGIKNADVLYSKSSQIKLFDELEKGIIAENSFFDSIRTIGETSVTNEQIRNAWNALLIGLPEENVQLLHDLKKNHRLFLLSNTNSIHEKAYREMIIKQYGHFIFDDIFEKMYLSHHLHMRKPDIEIFQFILRSEKLDPEKTFFIDDSPQHVNGARKTGMHAHHLKSQKLTEFFNAHQIV